jgi:hypothetical protein
MKKLTFALLFFCTIFQYGQNSYMRIWKGGVKIDSVAVTNDLTLSFGSGQFGIGALHDPILSVIFNENIYNHNFHITSDGNYLYTVNGGSASAGRIKRYTLSGVYIDSVMIPLDFRSIMYNRKDGYLYACAYDRNLYKITDMAAGTYQLLYTALFDYNQSSLALSWDGNFVYAFYQGTLKKYSLATGALVQTLSGFQYGSGNFGGDGAVAVDQDYIYTINTALNTVYVYTLGGVFVRNLTLSFGNVGISLSFVNNGYLFLSKDGNYGMGTWYGYNIRLSTSIPAISENISGTENQKTSNTVSKLYDSSMK